MNDNQTSFWKAEIPFLRRWKLWLLAWIIALVAAGFPNPGLIVIIWLFPWGLMDSIGWQRTGYDSDYVVGWLPYIVLTIAALLSRRRILYFAFFVILCVLLLLNIVGCHHLNAQASDMH